MPKKAIFGVLIAAAFLTLACLCCPTNIFPFLQTPTAVLPTPSPTATPSPSPTVEPTSTSVDILACVNNLTQVLYESENNSYSGPELQSEFTLVTYTVSGDAITDPVYVKPIPIDLKPYQEDTASQEKIWQFVTDIIPADQRALITRFVVFTDGVNNSLGAVEQTDDPHDWMLEMDIEDAKNFPDLSTTLIHELGHLLTLNDSQVTTDFEVFNNPDDQQVYDREAAVCSTYFMFEGCSQSDSYISTFFDRFWPNIYDEWQAINVETDQDALDQELDRFYQEYADQFVSSYAATSPDEDIAESFMYFIFKPKPSGASIAEEKYLFFYDYSEMVSLRESLLENLCTYADTP
jgi:hypothetical protein